MRTFLLAALWFHLASSVSIVGASFVLVLAGRSVSPTTERWEGAVVRWLRILVVIAIGSGIASLLLRTAVFEGRPQAALEARAVGHALLDTRAGVIWLVRHGLLIVLGWFLAMQADLTDTRNWIASRGEALALGVLVLALMSGSSHAAAVTPGTTRALAVDVVHLVATGVWIGGFVPLALLLWAASRAGGAEARRYARRAVGRFSLTALVAVALLMVSGVMNALVQVETVAGLAGTTHGRLLIAKLAVLVPIVAVAAVNRGRLLPALSTPETIDEPRLMRRLTGFVAIEGILALVLLGLVAAMTLQTPARHAQPVWPLPFRLSLDVLDVSATRWRWLVGSQLLVLGVAAVVAALVARGRRGPILAGAVALVVLGAGVGVPPIVVDAYPTTYRRPLVSYHATSIAAGMSVYRERCAACHGAAGRGDGVARDRQHPPADLRSSAMARRHAGEIFWLITHGLPQRGMPGFERELPDKDRWDVINFIRALGAADASATIGRTVEPERAWLVAPDFTVSVGPLAPGALRDHRGRRSVLVVLYTLPEAQSRMAQLARAYDLLWIMGVEVIAVPTDASPDAIKALGATPPVLFPVVTDGAADIVLTYRMFAPGPHTEVLIDRQGYIRAMWSGDSVAMPASTALTAQVEQLNDEKNVPPFPDDHVH